MGQEELREELEETDSCYVKARDIECFDDPRQAGKALKLAEAAGWVEAWSDAEQQPTYEVLL